MPCLLLILLVPTNIVVKSSHFSWDVLMNDVGQVGYWSFKFISGLEYFHQYDQDTKNEDFVSKGEDEII